MDRDIIRLETRSAPPQSSWDLLRTGIGYDSDAGVPVSAYLAENLSTVFGCVQIIAETVGMLPLCVYRKLPNGDRAELLDHPIAKMFGGDVNEYQVACEFFEMMTAHCALRGNAYAEIVRNNAGEPVALNPFHPDRVRVVFIAQTQTYAYDVSMLHGGTRRLLADEMLHLKDRSDDGIIGKSRLARARETFGNALATERYASSTFRNGAAMSGVLSHPEALGDEAADRLRKSFEATYSGSGNAGKIAVLEEGLKWMQVSVSPDDAQMLESRRFGVEALARIFRVPPPILGDYSGGNYASIVEIHRIFYGHCVQPWLNRWERLIEKSLLSDRARSTIEVELDADLFLRGDMLTRFQAYRIAREVGIYNANELRKFEKQNARSDPGGDVYFAPQNMQPTQTGQPVADRGGGNAAAA